MVAGISACTLNKVNNNAKNIFEQWVNVGSLLVNVGEMWVGVAQNSTKRTYFN